MLAVGAGGRIVGKLFPPDIDDLLVWSRTFRCSGTWQNYVSYVKTACLVVGAGVEVFEHPALKRATASIAKDSSFRSRPRMFIRRALLEAIVMYCSSRSELKAYGILFLMAYIFLLRVPSEALSAIISKTGPRVGHQAVLAREGEDLVLHLRRRKNKRDGSVLRRRCWCGESSITCPIHTLWRSVSDAPDGTALFHSITPANALGVVREVLSALEIPKAHEYRSHDFRRGHADDLRHSGAPLRTILEAGEWRSPSFLSYLDTETLEADFVLQAHLDESDEERG